MTAKNLLGKLIEKIDQKEVVGILKDLISVPGHVDCPGQEEEISKAVFALFEDMGMEVSTQKVEPHRHNVIARMAGSGKKKSLALNGHLDTVPPSDNMKHSKPYITDGKVYGLGAVDMKGGIAAMAYAMMLVKQAGIALDGDLFFTGVVGEESGGVGTHHLMAESGFCADYFVVGEPTGLKIVNSHKGVFNMEVVIEGKAVHASIPQKGLNAIDAMADFIYLLNHAYKPVLQKRSQEEVGSPSINCGIVRGGQKINVVADRCLLNLDRRWIEAERDVDMIAEIKPYLAQACAKDSGYRYHITPLLPQGRYFGPFFMPQDHAFVKICRNAFQKIGLQGEVSGMQGWTDGATILHRGFPALIIGPGAMEYAHTAEEHILISEVVDAVKFYISLILEICAGQPAN